MATVKGVKSRDETKLNITLASDDEGWDRTVNGQLVIELCRNNKLNVTGFVPKNTQQQREHAKSLNIELVDAKDHTAFSSSELLSFPPDSLEIDILLIHAHGQDLGRQAQIIKEAKKCKWVQVVHTISHWEEICEEQPKLQTLCEKADFIITVGPKVADTCKRALRSSGKHVFDLTPGVFEQLSGVRNFYGDLKTFHVLLSGSSKDFNVKGCDIAAKAIKLLNTPSASYHLTVNVKPCDNAEEVRKALLSEGIDSRQLTVRVSDSHKDWCKMLCEADLAIKPSRNEGFGISGLLAISADLPVLVSEYSGLGIVLRNIPLGNSSVVASDDPKVWADRIKQVRAKTSEIRHAEAVKLREAYMQQFSWKDQCDKLVEELFRIVPQKCGGHDFTSKSGGPTLNHEGDVENIQSMMKDASLSEGHSTTETKQKMTADVVDAGVKQNITQVNARLSTSVKGIPLNVYGRVCVMLNVKRDVKFDDFRMLAEKVGLDKDETNFIAQRENPTAEILKTWSKKPEATVSKLIEILKGKDLERMDVVKVLEDWVNEN